MFYALRVPPGLRPAARELARQVAREARGRPVPEDNLHVTLVFVGDAGAQALPALERAGASAAGAWALGKTEISSLPALELDRLGAFPRARVAWLAPSSPPKWPRALVEALERELDAEGIAFDRRTLRLHLTLARSCRGPFPDRAVDPIAWQPHAFELMRSPQGAAGGRYETLARWRLGALAS